jgi:hypothetical protein
VNSSDRSGLELRLRRQAMATVTNIWKLLSRYTDDEHDNDVRPWSSFATHNVTDPRSGRVVAIQNDTAVSLESWHDTMHGLIGTGVGYAGHMGVVGVAGVSIV